MKNNLVIVAGFQKCGTTAFGKIMTDHYSDKVNCMMGHPTDFLPEGNDEVDYFFDPLYEKIPHTKQWYDSLLQKDKINIDKSPNYASFTYDSSPSYIYNYDPNAKIIFFMRNPIDRAYSAWVHYIEEIKWSIKWGYWKPDKGFMWNFHNCKIFQRPGCYHTAIKSFLQKFPKENILTVIQERMAGLNHQEEWDRIFDFIGIPSRKIQNKEYFTRKNCYTRQLTDDERNIIRDYYRTEVSGLEELTGKIMEWKDFL